MQTCVFLIFNIWDHIYLTLLPLTLSFYRIVQWFADDLGVKLNEFIMDNPNTFYHVNGKRKRTFAAQANPDVLGYNVWPSEKGKSADELLQQALQKVRKKEASQMSLA